MARALPIAGTLLCALLCAVPAAAQERSSLSIGARLGGNFHFLSRPTDPAGEPTLLFGNAFGGVGPAAGLGLRLNLLDSSAGALGIELDLLWSLAQGALTVEDPQAGQSQRVELATHQLRVPVLLTWSTPIAGDALRARLLLGPELLAGLWSGSVVSSDGVPGEVAPLETTPVTHVGVTAGLGLAIGLGGWTLPVEVRGTFDPGVPGSTRERFQGYNDVDDPGAYQVAFDWQVGVLVGFDLDL